MKLQLRLFAKARDLVGQEFVELELTSSACIRDLKSTLKQEYPQLEPLMPGLLFAVGTDYAGDGVRLTSNCDVACFPPVSGG
ncbi:MAG: MoaD/ThiS family protein [Planctomycetaceae bacterium]